jgi:DNA/RNA-binding domain of Phe-tRNA-synthetase-like protein
MECLEMLRFVLDADVVDRVRAWAVGLDGVKVQDDGLAWQRLEDCAREWERRCGGLTAGQVDGVAAARRLYRDFGVDPTRTRPSSEALLRRALKGQSLYRLNNIVDVGNWVSLEFLLPLGLYDAAAVGGDVAEVRIGHEGEEYEGIRKGPVHVSGRLCVADSAGAFGSPTSDSLRTSITDNCASVATIVFAPLEVDEDRLEAAGRALAERLRDYAEGRIVYSEAVAGPS